MAEPQDLTRNGDGSFVPLTWAELGSVVEPTAGRKDTGWLSADVVTEEEMNWLSREPQRWLRALASRYLSSSEAFSASWIVPNGNGVWSTNGVGALQGFLSDGPVGANSLVADLWLDPNDAGGVKLQASVPKAAPHTFLATRDTYVFAPIDVISPPTITEPELTYLDVPVGDPQPATPAGTVPVWRVETDGATIVDQEILLVAYPVLKMVAFEALQAITLMLSGDLDVGGNTDLTGNLDVGGDLTVLGTLGDITCDSIVSKYGEFGGNLTFQPSINAVATAGAPTVLATGNGSTLVTQAAFRASGAGSVGLFATTSGTVDTVYATNTGSGSGVSADCSSGTGIGVEGTGGNAATGYGVRGTATHVSAHGTLGVTASGAALTTYGVLGLGSATGGSGVLGTAASGYGVVAEGDATSPAYSAFRLAPQDADPTTPQQGDVLFNDSRGTTGKVRAYTTQWESVHSSDKGWVKAWGARATGGPIAGGSGNLSLAQITPEEVGDVLVTATGSFIWSADNGSCTVALVDVTAAVTIATSTEYSNDTDGGTNQRSIVLRSPYTLPGTGTRTFAVVITATTGTITYDHVVCSVEGVA